MDAVNDNKTDRQKGFTLIELLVVISIIALLLSILMPSLQKAKEMARKTICGSNVRQIAIGLHSYATDNDGRMPLVRYWSQATQDIGPENVTPDGEPQANIQMTVLYIQKYLPSIDLYYSPCDKSRKPDTVGFFEHSFREDTMVDNQLAWDLIEQGKTHSSKLTLTYSYQQLLFVARKYEDWEVREECLRLYRYKTLVADRFCGDHMWSFHGGDEKLSLSENSGPVAENGEGWHIGFTDGSVSWRDNDMEIFDYMEDLRNSYGGFHWHWGGDWFKYWGTHQ